MMGAVFALSPVVGGGFISPAMAQMEAMQEAGPLVIIRFQHKNVLYDRSLYMAVSKALEVNPAMQFDVVAFAPVKGTPSRDRAYEKMTEAYLERVMGSLSKMGLPGGRVNAMMEHSRQVAVPEVHIFVR